MGIYVDYQLAYEGTEEDLLLKLNALRRRVDELAGARVGSIRRIEPVLSIPVLMLVEKMGLPLPEVVRERVAMLREDEGASQLCIEMDLLVMSGLPKRLLRRWHRQAERLLAREELWEPELYPKFIRHGVNSRRGVEALEELPDTPNDPFYGLTIQRDAIHHLIVDALHRYAYALIIDPGEGSETVDLTFSTYRSDTTSLWIGTGFTKTQYARDLCRAHQNVVAILDLLQEAGLLLRAHDNSGYYKHRDWEKAKRRIAAELALTGIAGSLMGGLVREIAGPGARVETVVDNADSAFDRLEALDVSPEDVAEGLRQAREAADEDDDPESEDGADE